MLCVFAFAICFINPFEAKAIPDNNAAVLISKYAKVAHWGVNDNGTRTNGESRSGQSLWTHRSDVNVVSGQNVKNDKPRVAYQYAVYKKPSSKADNDKIERLPAVGEVVQDRYNPRPYFGYGKIPPKSEQSATYAAPKPTPPSTSGFGFDSFPAVFNVAPSTSKPVDLYTSPYSSYNPPPMMSDSSPVTDVYPPSIQDSYAAPPPSDGQGSYDYKPKKPQEPPTPSYASLGPPLSLDYMPNSGDDSMPPSDHNNQDIDAPPSDHMGPMYHDNEPPHYPPKSEDDVYYPPDFDNGGGHDHSPKGLMQVPADAGMDMGMGMAMDQPPPDHNGRFPQYLYDSHHFDHHVYEEIPHTTTEAVEDKRVSSGNYSYYYLGRKLWYVPLYFSIYFIIYVTVLILKAIARHKIQYKQKWVSQTRHGRKLNEDQMEYLDNVTRNVTNGLDKAKKMYAFAM